MAKRTTKTTVKKSSTKVRDLAVRKDPKGGAQKRESPDLGGGTRARSTQQGSKSRLS